MIRTHIRNLILNVYSVSKNEINVREYLNIFGKLYTMVKSVDDSPQEVMDLNNGEGAVVLFLFLLFVINYMSTIGCEC